MPARVLMTADAVGGVWTYAITLARALAALHVRVDLATMGPRPSSAQRAEAQEVPGLSLHESDFALEWMDDPWQDVDHAGRWLLRLERDVGPDLVHLNGYAHGTLPFRAPRVVAGHSCVLSWWHAVRGGEAPSRYRRYRETVREGLLAAAAVMAPTRAMARELTCHYGIRGVVVVPNGIDPRGFLPSPKLPLVLGAGRAWDPAKNLEALEPVARHLAWPVVLAGALEEPGMDRRAATFSHLHGLGMLDRSSLARWMGRAAVFVHPASYEPFGLAPLEAALCGCALVLGDIPSLREIWGDAALFVDGRDRDDLV
ncbi:MAG TPA: glycosyltransferase family 4 protein, partial [Polyangiaceae bacterium]|nr:glycosyltransferase family 4 protein [Polyangiaceae bacterium]